MAKGETTAVDCSEPTGGARLSAVDTAALAGIAYVVFDGLSHGRFDIPLPYIGSLTALVLLVCLCLVAVKGLASRPRFAGLREPLAVASSAFIAYVFVSARVLGAGFDYGFAKNLTVVFAMLTFVRSSRARRVVFAAAAASGFVQTGLGIAQYLSVGMPQGGLTGFLPNHVQFGLYLSVSALATIPLALEAQRRWVRVAGWAVVAVEFAVVVASLARGVVVALACAAIVTVFIAVRVKWRAVAFTAAVGVVLAGIGAASGRFAQLARVPGALGDLAALNAIFNTRLQFILAAWNMFLLRPLFGFGYGRYREVWFEYAPAEILNPWSVGVVFAAHSTYLEIMAELGIVGLSLYVAVIATALVPVWRTLTSSHDLQTRATAAVVMCMLLLFVFHGTFDNSGWHDRVFWIILALGATLRPLGTSVPGVGYTTAEKPQVPRT